MPRTLSSVIYSTKNALGSTGAYLMALEITIPGTEIPVRVVGNTENITWRGETWTAIPFEIDAVIRGEKNTVPQIELRVGNVNGVIGTYIDAYDDWCKTNGYQTITVSIYALHTADLANDDPIAEDQYVLKQPKDNGAMAVFILSAPNPHRRRCPQARILKNGCPFKFKGLRCGYMGLDATCTHTYAACKAKGNATRYGGFVGAGTGGLDLVS